MSTMDARSSPIARRLPGAVHGARVALSSAGVAVVAVAAGRALDSAGMVRLDFLPFCIGAVALAVLQRRDWVVAALVFVGVPLLISRSVLAPAQLSAVTPLVVAFACVLFLIRNWRRVRRRTGTVSVLLLAVLLVVPAIAGGDSVTLIKGAGVGAMWLCLFIVAAQADRRDWRILALCLVTAMSFEAVIAIAESFFGWSWVRDGIAASFSDAGLYVVRPNLLLGWSNRAQGTVGYPIPLALLLVIALVLVVAGWTRRTAALSAVVCLVLIAGVAATGARSALVFLGVALVVALLGVGRGLRPSIRAGLAVVTALLASGVIWFLVRSITSNDYSIVHRGGMVESAAALLAQPIDRVLFGFGYNAPARLHDAGILRVDDLNVVDNALVTEMATSGLVGLALLLFLMVGVVVRGSNIARVLISVLFSSMFFFDLQSWHLVMFVLWLVVAAGLNAAPPKNRAHRGGARDLGRFPALLGPRRLAKNSGRHEENFSTTRTAQTRGAGVGWRRKVVKALAEHWRTSS